MKKLVAYGRDDHPDDDPERAPAAWSVAVLDDCEECNDVRVEVVLEEIGHPAGGVTGHLAPATARELRRALGAGLAEIGEDPGP
jgi:hypothetical protein